MTKRITALLAAIAGLFILTGMAPANASWEYGSQPSTAAAAPQAWDFSAPQAWQFGARQVEDVVLNPLNPWRFGTTSICLDNPLINNLPSGTVAQTFSYAADIDMVHDYGLNGCDTHSEATTIDILYYDGGSDPTCVEPHVYRDYATNLITNANLYVNYGTGATTCFDTAQERAYWISHGVGYLVGLAEHQNGNRSVMSTTYWSQHNLTYLEDSDYYAIERRYPW